MPPAARPQPLASGLCWELMLPPSSPSLCSQQGQGAPLSAANKAQGVRQQLSHLLGWNVSVQNSRRVVLQGLAK